MKSGMNTELGVCFDFARVNIANCIFNIVYGKRAPSKVVEDIDSVVN